MDLARPTATTEIRDGMTLHVLREPSSGSEAWITPEIGANCVWFATTVGERPLDVIGKPPSWDVYRERPTFHGAAILFPFPGRIRAGKFAFMGRDYQLPLNEPDPGNAIHGCVCGAAWTTVSLDTSPANGARAVYRINTDTSPHLLDQFPFPFELHEEVRLCRGALHFAFTATNLGKEPMPIGLGLHPYIPLPLGDAGTVDDCEIAIDAPYYWAQEGHMPVGRTLPADQSVDLRTARSLRALASVGIGGEGRMVNIVHTQFSSDAPPLPSSAGIRWELRNPKSGRSVVVEADTAFSASVTYVPVSREKISFEPHTAVPNAFNLANEGLVAGVVTLGPREFWRGSVKISAGALAR
jgi:aldose 1-epimerase